MVQLTQPKGQVSKETNKDSIARKFGCKKSEVVYFEVGTNLFGYKVIYDKTTQRAYSLPADITAGTTAVSLSVAAVLVHSKGSVDLGALAVSRGEFVTVPGSFALGATINVKNERLEHGGVLYYWDGALPKVVTPGTVPDLGVGKWLLGDNDSHVLVTQPFTGAATRSQHDKNSDVISAKDFGVTTSSDDNQTQFLSAISSGIEINIPVGSYKTTSISSAIASAVYIKGSPGSKIVQVGAGNLFQVNSITAASVITDIEFNLLSGNSRHGLAMVDQNGARVKGVKVTGLDTIGTGVIAYSTSGQVQDCVHEDISVYGDRANSTNTNGWLLVDHLFSRVCNILASGIKAFAIELKNAASHNVLSNLIARSSDYGLYYGSDVTGKNPSFNVATGLVTKDCDTGYVPGGGSDNVLGGALFDMRESIVSSSTATARIGSQHSVIYGGHVVGTGNFVRYEDDAKNNYTQMSFNPMSTSFNYVVYEAGSERNALEVTHPGALNNSIRPNVPRPDGMPVSGPQANPVWCHATGEYLGTLGPGWLWQHDDSSGTRSTAHKWRFEGKGDSQISISTDGVGVAGLNVNTPAGNRDVSWLESGSYWQISGGSFGVRLYSSILRPNADNTMANGGASQRWTQLFAVAGTINTSDGREKTEPLSISALSGQMPIGHSDTMTMEVIQDEDRILDAWADVSIIAYRWLASLEQKGDDARWHFGVIAQQVRDAFLAHGIDGTRFGLLCYDKWDDEYEPVFEEWETEEWGTDASGRRVSYRLKHRRDTGEVRLVTEAGDRWGIRPEQCLFLEAALQRRNYSRQQQLNEQQVTLIEQLSSRLDALESK